MSMNSRTPKGDKKSEDRFRFLFEKHPLPTFLVKLNGFVEEVNEAVCELVGYDRDEIVGSLALEAPFLTEEGREKVREMFEKRLEGEKIDPYNVEIETGEGERRVLKVDTELLAEKGEVVGIIGTAYDIPERD